MITIEEIKYDYEVVKMLPKCDVPIKKHGGLPKKTNEQYVKELKEKAPTIISLEEYQNARQKILHQCLICNYIWSSAPSNILSGKGCPNCKLINSRTWKIKSDAQYIEDLKKKMSFVIPLESYVSSHQKILHMNMFCKHIFMISPTEVLSNPLVCSVCGTKMIGQKLSKTHEQYLKELEERNIPVIPLEEYRGVHTKILHLYPCGHCHISRPDHVLNGFGCIICSAKERGKKLQLSKEEFCDRLILINPNIIIISTYKGMNNKISCECKLCKNIWDSYPSSLIQGHGCPKCASSFGEKRIQAFFDNTGIYYIHQMKFEGLLGTGNRQLSYDFYLPEYNKLIEFNGRQHKEPVEYFGGEKQFQIQQEHDKRKREYAKEHDIDLLEIWYYDYNDIEEILTKYLNLESRTTVQVA